MKDMKLKARKYMFNTSTQWMQVRQRVFLSKDKIPIETAFPPEFGGQSGYWTAEHLFVASEDEYKQCFISKAFNIRINVNPVIRSV